MTLQIATPLRSWPKTVDEAVALVISSLARDEKQGIQCMAEEDLFFLGFGENIRNQCGLWAGNVGYSIHAAQEKCIPMMPRWCSLKRCGDDCRRGTEEFRQIRVLKQTVDIEASAPGRK
jgi:hypothetical protein